jgi:hypothetical protein
MRYSLGLLSLAGAVVIAKPALAQDSGDPLVQCAWSRAGSTSETLVSRLKFDRQYVYDADGSPTVGLIMRIWAACREEHPNLVQASSERADLRRFLRRLKATRPRAIAADSFNQPVFRCETFFLDAPDLAAAAIGWGYGSDLSQHQLSYTATIQGHEQTISSADLEDPIAISQLLEEGDRVSADAVEVETIAEGRASGRPYRVSATGGRRACKFINSDGSYTDA